MRRRFQRRLDEAMAAGIVLTPRALGSRKRRFGIKPRFYTSWLAQGGEKWDEMMVRSLSHSVSLSSDTRHQYSLYLLSLSKPNAAVNTPRQKYQIPHSHLAPTLLHHHSLILLVAASSVPSVGVIRSLTNHPRPFVRNHQGSALICCRFRCSLPCPPLPVQLTLLARPWKSLTTMRTRMDLSQTSSLALLACPINSPIETRHLDADSNASWTHICHAHSSDPAP